MLAPRKVSSYGLVLQWEVPSACIAQSRIMRNLPRLLLRLTSVILWLHTQSAWVCHVPA
jgi:hypothetical protein